jgi:phosphoserine phosphatase
MHRYIFSLIFKNKSSLQITHLVNDFLSKKIDSYVNPVALDLLQKAQKDKCLTALFSSSPDFLVQPIAYFFKFDECLATKYAVDKEGVFCDISLIVEGEVKAAHHAVLCEKYKLNSKENFVYTDSENDLPLMFSAGNCYVFHPNKKLLKYCIANDWTAIYSKEYQ